ncbi:hypothetical protein ABZ297_29750 [Nonomuraea sp. NPDC005983]|uniref:hypothetical protein n=1 Tax=Nonomuraea sp. NPDC005983 TaxID=3155595 RepID=UPI0033A755B8
MVLESSDAGRLRAASPQLGRARMSNVTRYLCAAAYLDSGWRDKVLSELLLDEFRAVAPSHGGFDLIPVIHHCRRSRSVLVVRDALITLIVVTGLVLQPLATIGWLAAMVPFVLLTTEPVRRGPLYVRVLIWIWAGPALAWPLAMLAFPTLVSAPASGPGALFVPLAILVTALAYRIATYMTLSRTLGPGAPEPAVVSAQPKLARRLDYLRRAQWGNVTMYAGEDAFMGAGTVERSWSIAVELDRVRSQRTPRRQAEPVDLDPVELHAHVRARLVEMRDNVLRPNESLRRLDIGDHVVTRGRYTPTDWGDDAGAHPMVDASGLPRPKATAEEIAAIARHPQGGIRYYQRVTITNAGQEIRHRDGGLVAPAEDQEALTSAFIHLAVEGRMLTTQFVVTVLPPVRERYHLVDRLPTMTTGAIAWEAASRLKLRLLRDVLAGPARLVRVVVQAVRQANLTSAPSRHLVYPYGAGFSVRELGASRDLQTCVQALDARKYVKLIEQRLTEAVLDFLEERGIETRAYRIQAAGVVMNTMTSGPGGLITGPLTLGTPAAGRVGRS